MIHESFCPLCRDPYKVTQLTQLRPSVQKLLTYLANLWAVLVEIHGGERVQSLNYALTLEDGPSTWSVDRERALIPRATEASFAFRAQLTHCILPFLQRREGRSSNLATVLNYDPGVPDLGKSPNPFSCLFDLLEKGIMAISYLMGLLGDIKTLDSQT